MNHRLESRINRLERDRAAAIGMASDFNDLQAENARLRAALEEIASPRFIDDYGLRGTISDLRSHVRRALHPSEEVTDG